MIPVAEALDRILSLFQPLSTETIPLRTANGRVLAQSVTALRDQPPFAASAMDGYAVRDAEVMPGATFKVIGEAAAGNRFDGTVAPGQAVRIFTGAPVPDGTDRIVIQEDCARDGDWITLGEPLDTARYVRPAGGDFKAGTKMDAPRRLNPSDIALLASMNIAELTVARKPQIALIATGDELAMPGGAPGPDQIISSNNFGLAAMIEAAGGIPRILPIARDNADSLAGVFQLARSADAIVTLGGASVGDHDLVAKVGQDQGLELDFYKVAMRPGKPLMAGQMNGVPMLGLPGNPVSSMVCGHVFLRPAIDAMLGLPKTALPRIKVPLRAPLTANGPREHYMRATLQTGQVQAFDRQDSSLISVLATANAFIIRPPNDPAKATGDMVDVIVL